MSLPGMRLAVTRFLFYPFSPTFGADYGTAHAICAGTALITIELAV